MHSSVLTSSVLTYAGSEVPLRKKKKTKRPSAHGKVCVCDGGEAFLFATRCGIFSLQAKIRIHMLHMQLLQASANARRCENCTDAVCLFVNI